MALQPPLPDMFYPTSQSRCSRYITKQISGTSFPSVFITSPDDTKEQMSCFLPISIIFLVTNLILALVNLMTMMKYICLHVHYGKNTKVVLKFMRSIHRTTNVIMFFFVCFFFKGENFLYPKSVAPIKKKKKFPI